MQARTSIFNKVSEANETTIRLLKQTIQLNEILMEQLRERNRILQAENQELWKTLQMQGDLVKSLSTEVATNEWNAIKASCSEGVLKALLNGRH